MRLSPLAASLAVLAACAGGREGPRAIDAGPPAEAGDAGDAGGAGGAGGAGRAGGGQPGSEPAAGAELVLAGGGVSAPVVVAPEAGPWEKRAAEDLVKYIGVMTGAKPALAGEAGAGPAIVVGRRALEGEPALRAALERVLKKNPLARADAIVASRRGDRVYLAGSNDESHYFAAAWLLQRWGCRWYVPTDFGEVIPERPRLTVGALDHAYAPPFEIRHYWLSWNADATGAVEFRRRNFMTETTLEGMGHALGKYTRALVPPGKTIFNVPLSEEATAVEVARQIEPEYARGVDGISLAIEDGNYVSDSPSDRALAVEYDKYMLRPSATDAMMTLYNRVGRILRDKHPASRTRIGGMAYANVTLPPKVVTSVEPNVVMWLAPIDFDPIHGMDDPRSPPRQEYGAIMRRWAELLGGRLAIYDYDQGMLVWRDLPAPSHQAFARDVKHYARAGILGVGTESRGATATTFLNLFFRGQLMWDPEVDVEALLAEFYRGFYGPAAAAMSAYWGALFAAWRDTAVTEHEYMLAPAIYTPALIAKLGEALEAAEAAIEPLRARAARTRNEALVLERMRFTRLGFEILRNYLAMVRAAAADASFAAAAAFGDKALAAREELTAMNPTFTTYKKIGERGPAWFPGEVQQMRDLAALTDGTKGTLVLRTPLEWAFRVEAPLSEAWRYAGPEGGVPRDGAPSTEAPAEARGWRRVRTDLYLQAQGVLNAEGQSPLGHIWYQATVELDAAQAGGNLRLMFPGLFNEAWLYVDGALVAHRPYREPWWLTDYKFEWDVDLTGRLKPGRNVIALRGFNPHHFGGMFRRPFIYRSAR